MPPHCDSLDGPVVSAARLALETDEVDLILPYVDADGEHELRDAFDRARKVRTLGGEARDVADRWFFETAVRVHRAGGEGAPFTGLKPAGGLDVGPVIPTAERAWKRETSTNWSTYSARRSEAKSSDATATPWRSNNLPARASLKRGNTSRRCSACRCGRMASIAR